MHSIVKKQFVRLDTSAPARAAAPETGRGPRQRPSCEKSVRVLNLEGQVHALEITCSCGETTVVQLEYPESKD